MIVEGQFEPSGWIKLDECRIWHLKCFPKVRSHEWVLIRVEIRIVDFSFVVMLSTPEQRHAPFRIENMSDAPLFMKQLQDTKFTLRTYPLPSFLVGPRSTEFYAWEEEMMQNPKILQLFFGTSVICLQPDVLGKSESFRVQDDGKEVELRLTIFGDGPTKVVRVSNSADQVPRLFPLFDEKVDLASIDLLAVVPKFGLSLVDNSRKELLYIFVEYLEVSVSISEKHCKTHVIVKDLQIDDMFGPSNMLFPVILHSKRNSDTLPFVQIRVFYSQCTPSMRHFRYFGILVQEFEILLDERVIGSTLSFASRLLEDFSKTSPSLTRHSSIASTLFFDTLELYPLRVSVSFHGADHTSQDENALQTFLLGLGMLVKDFEEAPVRLNGILLNHVHSDVNTLISSILSQYKQQFLVAGLGILSSSNLLGNPLSFVNHLGTGIVDLVREPVLGFNKGPAEFGLGIAKGGLSFFRHSLGGISTSLAAVTGSIGTAFAVLSADDEYLTKRREAQMRARREGIVGGVVHGGKRLGLGFFEGITGIVTAPIESAQKEGVKGFFKGLAKGTVGVVVKPVSGILDAASSVARGASTSVMRMKSKNRVRLPRVFYGHDQRMLEYSIQDARIAAFLRNHELEEFRSAYVSQIEAGAFTFVILSRALVLVSVAKEIEVLFSSEWNGIILF